MILVSKKDKKLKIWNEETLSFNPQRILEMTNLRIFWQTNSSKLDKIQIKDKVCKDTL